MTYVREFLAEHISGIFTQLPSGFYWLKDRLEGVPAPAGCTSTSPQTLVNDPQFGPGLAAILPAAAQALVGQAIGAGR